MLARTVAAVKFDLSSTPEQAACAKNIDEGLKTFWTLVERLQPPPTSNSRSIRSKRPSSGNSWRSGAGCSRRSWTCPVLGTSGRP